MIRCADNVLCDPVIAVNEYFFDFGKGHDFLLSAGFMVGLCCKKTLPIAFVLQELAKIKWCDVWSNLQVFYGNCVFRGILFSTANTTVDN